MLASLLDGAVTTAVDMTSRQRQHENAQHSSGQVGLGTLAYTATHHVEMAKMDTSASLSTRAISESTPTMSDVSVDDI